MFYGLDFMYLGENFSLYMLKLIFILIFHIDELVNY